MLQPFMFMNRAFVAGLILFFFANNTVNATAQDDQKKVDYEEVVQAFDLIFSEPQRAINTLNQLEKRTKQQHDSLYGIVLNNIGVYYGVQNNTDSALHYFERAVNALMNYDVRKAKTFNNMGIVLKNAGRYGKSLEALRMADQIAQKTQNFDLFGLIYGEYASVYKAMENYELATEYLLKSINYWERGSHQNSIKIAVEKQKLGSLYAKLSNFDFAEKLFDEAKGELKDSPNQDAFFITLAAQANMYLDQGRYDTAEIFLKEAEAGLMLYNNPIWNNYTWEMMGRYYEGVGIPNLAERYYLKAISEGLEHHIPRLINTMALTLRYAWSQEDVVLIDSLLEFALNTEVFRDILRLSSMENQSAFYESMTRIMELKEDYEQAYRYAQKIIVLSDSIALHFNRVQIEELYKRYELKVQQHQDNMMQQEAKEKRRSAYFASAMAVFLFLGLYCGWLFYNYRKKNNIKAFKALTAQHKIVQKDLEKEKALGVLKDKIIKEKEVELIEQTSERIRLQEEIARIDEMIKKEGSPILDKGLKRIRKKDSQNWNSTIEKFKAINPILLVNLSKPEYNLTRSEIDFCVLAAMQLSNKEIANIMGISTTSVATKKYRLIRKLNLSENMGFDTWLGRQLRS
jgi:tetratricopeptide (TPR) repeat protein/DNA-binding CsgD family transcriptional regulator